MTQTDFNVANASGAAVRADINAHLDAMVSLSSGTVAPAIIFPNQWWMDTSTNILKQRDNGNTAWINIASKVGSVWIPYRSGALLTQIAAGITGLTAETAPAIGDEIGLQDVSAGAERKMTLANMLKVINGLTEDAAPVAGDFFMSFDTSAGAMKKVDKANIGGGFFTEGFISALQTITAGGALTIAHGLAARPTHIRAELECTVADVGYAVGDPLDLTIAQGVKNQVSRGVSIVPDGTNLKIRFGANLPVFTINRKDTGADANTTFGRWKIRFLAWR